MMWRSVHSLAASRSPLPSPPSAAESAPVTAPHINSASEPSLQVPSRLASSPRRSALERVSSDVLILILQCLSARHKLTVRRLCRAFHSLPDLAFLHDSIDSLLPDGSVDDSREDGKTGQLRFLRLTVMQEEEAGRWTLFTCPRSLSSLPPLSGLEDLRVRLRLSPHVALAATLRCLLRSVLSLPSLQRLDITIHKHWQGSCPETDWTDAGLPSSASLRYLTLLRLSLSAASVLRLCSLPLDSLDLNGCCLLAVGDNAVYLPERTAGSSALRTLSLPDGEHSLLVLQLSARAAQCASRLEQLTCRGPPSRALLGLIASYAKQLRELNLASCNADLRSGPALDLSPLTTASGAPCLPLLTTLLLPGYPTVYEGESNQRQEPELEQAFTTASQQLIASYCAQLTSLSVTVVSAPSINTWLCLLLDRCHHLHHLGIRSCGTRLWNEPPLQLQLEPAGQQCMDRLQGLELCALPLSDGSLLSLLSRCPELEICLVLSTRHLTKAGKQAAFRRCPKLTYGRSRAVRARIQPVAL
jgi:hypothetical protein